MSEIILKINRPTLRVVLNGTVPITGGGGGTITVKESDGSPSVSADTIIFPNGTVTDSGSGDATFNPSNRYTALSNLSISDVFFGKNGSTDYSWTRDQEVDFLAGGGTLLEQFFDGGFSGFALSNIKYQVDGFSYMNNGSGWNYMGHGSYNTSGLSFSNAADGVLGIHSTANENPVAANTSHYIYRITNVFFRGASANGACGFYGFTVIKINGTNWDNTGASTGTRLWNGYASSSGVYTSDSVASIHTVGFSRLNVNGGVTDANWMFVSSNGTSQERTSTGITFTDNNDIMVFEILCPPAGTSVYGRVRNITDSTDSGIITNSTYLPGATTALGYYQGWRSIDAVSRSLGVQTMITYTKRFYI